MKALTSLVKNRGKDTSNGPNFTHLIVLLGIFLLIPALVIFSQSIVDSSGCTVDQVSCKQKCVSDYSTVVIIFQSQTAGQAGCEAGCVATAQKCQQRVVMLILAALFLSAGLFISCCLLFVLRAITASAEDGGNITAVTAKPRASAEEPKLNEEDWLKQENSWRRWVPSVRPLDMKLVQATCRQCSVVVMVDKKWFTNAKSGYRSAICNRCGNVVAGIV